MAKKTNQCVMDGCTREAAYPKTKVCKACYAFMFYWKDRSVKDRMAHAHKIEAWDARARAVLMPSRVTSISRPRRRRAG